MIKHLFPDGSALFKEDKAFIQRALELTKWFDKYEVWKCLA